MSFDVSKIMYPHWTCGKFPCECTFEHKKLTFQIIQCSNEECKLTFFSFTEMANHHLEMHEKPIVEKLSL